MRLSLTPLVLVLLGTPLSGQVRSLRAQPSRPPTVDEAEAFVDRVERDLGELLVRATRAGWVASNFITHDTEALSAEATANLSVAMQRFAIESRRFEGLQLPADLDRKLRLVRMGLSEVVETAFKRVTPPPGNATDASELARISASMEADFGRGAYCRTKKKDPRAPSPQGDRPTTPRTEGGGGANRECLQSNAVTRLMATSEDPGELLDVWQGWHGLGAALRGRYQRFVDLANRGARELGFTDVGALWRAGYDLPPNQFVADMERLWGQVRPLYVALHAHVRAKLGERYGTRLVPHDGMIPAHLLGNMWAQDWSNVYRLVAPPNTPGPDYDVTQLLETKKVDQLEMVRIGERFFTSLGLPKLPGTFWERSLFVKPRDRDVVCAGSAWNVDGADDVRLKMCIEVTAQDFVTVHHELGHNYYALAYKDQPLSFRSAPNDGFQEAIGDAIALSITPEYLRSIGLLSEVPSVAADTMLLLRQALDKIAFLPFGLLVDQWRWKVFSGEIAPRNYNGAWWQLRDTYQGVSAPVARTEADFDPGAKYHVPANFPYTRYFLARVLQFQFYRALCREAGHSGPLYRCSFYGNRKAGEKLWAMLAMGASRPWPDALEALTGERQLSADALLEYFAPLKAWLDEQNKGRTLGWGATAPGSSGGR